jgi:cell pole-organizing protein PopZ
MSDPKGQQEPSMEEILASIRRIIAEDGDAPATAEAARHDEILELTEVVEEDGTVVSLTPGGKKPMLEPVPSVPPPAPSAPPVKRAAPPPPPPEPAFETKPVSAPEPEPPPRADRLMSGAAAAASIAAMSQLTAAPARPVQMGAMALGDAGRTLEDLVRELLRPMLKDWLDAQLPKIVERLVQEEIQRMSREAQGR